MSEQRKVVDIEKEEEGMQGGLRKIGTGLNAGWRRGASHSVELDHKVRTTDTCRSFVKSELQICPCSNGRRQAFDGTPHRGPYNATLTP